VFCSSKDDSFCLPKLFDAQTDWALQWISKWFRTQIFKYLRTKSARSLRFGFVLRCLTPKLLREPPQCAY
jgi:hypothetical protein